MTSSTEKQAGGWKFFKWGGGGGGGGGKKAKNAHMGDESNMYYNAELKRWVEKGKEHEAAQETSTAAPPKMAAGLPTAPSGRKGISQRYVLQNNLSVSSSASSLADVGALTATMPRASENGAGPPRFLSPPGSNPGVENSGLQSESSAGMFGSESSFIPSAPNSGKAPLNFFIPSAPNSGKVPANFFIPKASSAEPSRQTSYSQFGMESTEAISNADTASAPAGSSTANADASNGLTDYSATSTTPVAGEASGFTADEPVATSSGSSNSLDAVATQPASSADASASSSDSLDGNATSHDSGPASSHAYPPSYANGWSNWTAQQHAPETTAAAAVQSHGAEEMSSSTALSGVEYPSVAAVHEQAEDHHESKPEESREISFSAALPKSLVNGFRAHASSGGDPDGSSNGLHNTAFSKAKHVHNKGKELLGAFRNLVHIPAAEDGSELNFDDVMHPGGMHKLDGPLPWELPDHLKHSDQFISICSNWQKNNPGVEYSPELLLASISGPAPIPASPSPPAAAAGDSTTADGTLTSAVLAVLGSSELPRSVDLHSRNLTSSLGVAATSKEAPSTTPSLASHALVETAPVTADTIPSPSTEHGQDATDGKAGPVSKPSTEPAEVSMPQQEETTTSQQEEALSQGPAASTAEQPPVERAGVQVPEGVADDAAGISITADAVAGTEEADAPGASQQESVDAATTSGYDSTGYDWQQQLYYAAWAAFQQQQSETGAEGDWNEYYQQFYQQYSHYYYQQYGAASAAADADGTAGEDAGQGEAASTVAAAEGEALDTSAVPAAETVDVPEAASQDALCSHDTAAEHTDAPLQDKSAAATEKHDEQEVSLGGWAADAAAPLEDAAAPQADAAAPQEDGAVPQVDAATPPADATTTTAATTNVADAAEAEAIVMAEPVEPERGFVAAGHHQSAVQQLSASCELVEQLVHAVQHGHEVHHTALEEAAKLISLLQTPELRAVLQVQLQPHAPPATSGVDQATSTAPSLQADALDGQPLAAPAHEDTGAALKQDLQADYEQRLQTSTAALEAKAEEQVSTARQQLQEQHEVQLAELRSQLEQQHAQQLVALRAELEAKQQADLAALRQEFEARQQADLAALREEMEEQRRAEVAMVRQEMEGKLQQLEEEVEVERAKGADMDELLLCLGQESTKVQALAAALFDAGLDPDAVTGPIEEEYASMQAGEEDGEVDGEGEVQDQEQDVQQLEENELVGMEGLQSGELVEVMA